MAPSHWNFRNAKTGLARIAWILMLALLLWGGPTLRADTLTGEVRGAVLDVDGGVPLSGVQMKLVNIDRGWSKQQMTDTFGNFAFLQLEPGNYTVSAEYEGYYPQEKTGVLIRLNQPKVVLPPFQLRKEVPTPTQQITLQGEQTKTALIDLTATGPNPVILAYLSEPGSTLLTTITDWAARFNFDSKILGALPLRGVRSFDQLALLAPGVFRVPFTAGQGPSTGIGVGTAGQFSVNGLRGRSNNFTIDGSDNNDEDIGVRRQGFVSLISQSNESVQEFQIVTYGFPAEFGRNSGSMVNAVSRSGASRIHGEVYGLFSDSALNARNFFDQTFDDRLNDGDLDGGSFNDSDFDQQLFGAVAGAPIIDDKLFFFGSIERQQSDSLTLGHFVVPTAGERGLQRRRGFIPIEELDEFFDRIQLRAGNTGFLYSARAGEGVFSLYPLPNHPDGPFGAHTYSQVRPQRGDGALFSTKLDWYLSPVHSFAGRFNFTDDDSLIPFTSESFNSSLETDTRTQNISLFLNSTTPGYANALRFSYGRTRLEFPAAGGDPLIFGSRLPSPIPPVFENAPAFGQVIETPFGRFGPFGTTGPIGQLQIVPYSSRGIDVFNFPQGRVDNNFQLSNFLTLPRARHTLKFGFDFRRSQLNSFSDRNHRPLVQFGYGTIDPNCINNFICPVDLAGDFARGTDLAALGAPAGFLQAISTSPVPDSTIGLNLAHYNLFIQDDWKLASNFTLNLGLRWEIQPAPSERNKIIEDALQVAPGQFAELNPISGSQLCQDIIDDRVTDVTPEQATICRTNRAFTASLNALIDFLAGRNEIYEQQGSNLAPRIGFAWDPRGNGKTVLRGGYGIAFDANLGAVTSQSRNVFPRFTPLNLNPNLIPATGLLLPHPVFFDFVPTGGPIIVPGSLNVLNQQGDGLATFLGALFNRTVMSRDGSLVDLRTNRLAFTLPEREFHRSYAQHWALSLQRQWGNNWFTAADYVGTRGINLTRFSTPNGGLLTTPLLAYSLSGQSIFLIDRPPAIPFETRERPMPDLGAIRIFENSAQSTHHALQISGVKRFSRGVEFRTQYTWSHTLDEVSDPFDARGFSALPQDSRNLRLERASANFDATHRFSFYAIWELPGQSRHSLLRDWRVSAIGEFQSGQPFTVNTFFDQNGDGNLTDRPDSLQGISLHPDTAFPVRLDPAVDPRSLLAPRGENGSVGRNPLRADGVANIDLALSRSFTLAEETRLDLRVEFFNLFNHTQFGIPIRILDSPAFGRTFDTQVEARSIRFGVKLVF